jgi:hypothetical protein
MAEFGLQGEAGRWRHFSDRLYALAQIALQRMP